MRKIFTKVTAIIAVVSTLITASMIEFYAANVDFSGGVSQVAEKVTSQAKTIAATIFGVLAIFCLAFTIAKGVKAAIAYQRQDDVHLGPVISGGIGTIVAGLASLSTFFGWFGL